jgi:Tfp pilus assembly protein PilF
MSLLMDAMRQAEANRRAGKTTGKESGKPEETAGLSLADRILDKPLTPIPVPDPGSQLPEIALYMESVSEDLKANPPPPSALPPFSQLPPRRSGERSGEERPRRNSESPAPRPRDDNQHWRDEVSNAFAAKRQASQLAEREQRRPLFWLLGATGMAVLAIGGYFWYQLNQIGGTSFRPAPAAKAATPATPFPLPAGNNGSPAAATPERLGNAGTGSPLPAPIPLPPLESKDSAQGITLPRLNGDSTNNASRNTPAESAESGVAARSPALNPSVPAAHSPRMARASQPPIQLQRTASTADQLLQRAYQSLQAGSLESARRDYEQVRQLLPRNVDALLGLANIAQRQGRTAEAERLLRQAAELDPKEPYIQASLLSLQGSGNQPGQSTNEGRLKGLVEEQPQSASAHFSLGNHYARQNRWNEAQQAYFNAWSLDRGNPDYLFNLAVSLDHLRQNKLAVRYYQQALEASATRSAAFDRSQLEQRLGDLRDVQP